MKDKLKYWFLIYPLLDNDSCILILLELLFELYLIYKTKKNYSNQEKRRE